MSGRKYVTLTEDEARRLRAQAARANTLAQSNAALLALNQRLDDSLVATQRNVTALSNNLQRMTVTVQQNQREASQQVAALHQQLQAAVAASNARLQAANEQHEADMQQMRENVAEAIRQTREDVADAIATNNRRVEEAMNHNNEVLSARIDETHAQIAAVSDRVDTLAAAFNDAAKDREELRDMAREYLEMAEQLNADAQTYRCEVLLPGALKPVLARAAEARDDYELALRTLENAATARLSARNAYLAALAFHEQIVLAEQAWILAHHAAAQAVDTAQTQISSCETVTEEATQISIDVDYWTDGDLGDLEAEANGLRRHLDIPTKESTLTTDDLNDIVARAEQITVEAEEAAIFAMEAACNNQDRAIRADVLCEILSSVGLQVVDGGYQQDQRSGLRVVLKNPVTNVTLVITQAPVVLPDGGVGTNLEIEFVEIGQMNQQTVANLVGDIQQALGRNGVNVTFNEVPGFEDIHSGRKETADMERWCAEQAPVIRPERRTRQTTRPAQGGGAAGGNGQRRTTN